MDLLYSSNMHDPLANAAEKTLRGLGWNHPRGLDCLMKADRALHNRTGISIKWEARSLREFGDTTTRDQFNDFDLIVLDHPHVPEAVNQGLLVAIDEHRPQQVAELALSSAGPSHQSYHYLGHQWGLAIDAAAQVSAFRPDLVDRAPVYWHEALANVARGTLLWPYAPVDAISTFFTLCSQLGAPVGSEAWRGGNDVVERALDILLQLAAQVPDWCATATPIDIAEVLAGGDGYHSAVALYGYSNYSRAEFRSHLVVYQDAPSFDGSARGAVLGGAGLAVSALSDQIDDAIEAVVFLSSPHCQASEYVDGGGQPGNALAWQSHRVNELSHHFFANTLRTIEGAWVRPHRVSWPTAQLAASRILHDALRSGVATAQTLKRIRAILDEEK